MVEVPLPIADPTPLALIKPGRHGVQTIMQAMTPPITRAQRVVLLALALSTLAATNILAAPFDHPWAIAPRDPATLAVDLDRLAARPAGSDGPVWVTFRDKGIDSDQSFARARAAATAALCPAARARRAVVGGSELVDYLDLPVRPDYVAAVVATGARLRHVSRWLNAVSVEASTAELERIAALPGVARLTPVARGRRSPLPEPIPASGAPDAGAGASLLDYGSSLAQLAEIQVTAVHDLGYSGQGVIVCMLDTGFYKDHEAFASIINDGRLIAERDFINGDWNTQNEPGDPSSQHNHGTYTWSALGGESPGELYGPAYGATFAIAKTEDVSDEQPIEEDFWLAASEWADSLGANVISSSLAYLDWYTYEDMDGNTAVTTNAADIAASRNILVSNSAANEGNSPWHYIAAPADADSILAVGATDSDNVVASFSSWGPTYDGRIKPDVCARGVGTRCATSQSTSSYGGVSGTSLSAPLVGGAIALVMEARPTWSAWQVRRALMLTADTAADPDNHRGFGRIRVLDAIDFSTVALDPQLTSPTAAALRIGPNPLVLPAAIDLDLTASGRVVIDLYGAGGRHVTRLAERHAGAGTLRLTWDGRVNGQRVPAGVYLVRARGEGLDARAKVVLTR